MAFSFSVFLDFPPTDKPATWQDQIKTRPRPRRIDLDQDAGNLADGETFLIEIKGICRS